MHKLTYRPRPDNSPTGIRRIAAESGSRSGSVDPGDLDVSERNRYTKALRESLEVRQPISGWEHETHLVGAVGGHKIGGGRHQAELDADREHDEYPPTAIDAEERRRGRLEQARSRWDWLDEFGVGDTGERRIDSDEFAQPSFAADAVDRMGHRAGSAVFADLIDGRNQRRFDRAIGVEQGAGLAVEAPDTNLER